MTIENRKGRAEYEAHDAAKTVYARVTNDAYEAIRALAAGHGLVMPNDDRAENLVTKIFTTLWDANHPRRGDDCAMRFKMVRTVDGGVALIEANGGVQ